MPHLFDLQNNMAILGVGPVVGIEDKNGVVAKARIPLGHFLPSRFYSHSKKNSFINSLHVNIYELLL